MTLDEAILHCEEMSRNSNCKCANEHKQLKEWLVEFKKLKESQEEISSKMKKQCVVRTVTTSHLYWYDPEKTKHLTERLSDGWVVVMCNPVGNDLEYILEKEIIHQKED